MTVSAAARIRPIDAQRKRALAKANDIRSARARLKVQVRDCALDPAALLDMPECSSMKIIDLLTSQRGVGDKRAHRVLRRAGISPSRPLAALTERERTALFERKAA